VRRVDLRRESFSRYQMLIDSFPNAATFGPGSFAGDVHTNHDVAIRYGSAATASTLSWHCHVVGQFRRNVHLLSGDSASDVPMIAYPADSTYPRLDTLALAGNLRFAP
jgi:hypothetical protein